MTPAKSMQTKAERAARSPCRASLTNQITRIISILERRAVASTRAASRTTTGQWPHKSCRHPDLKICR